jgi:hypothetical protein
MGASTFPPKADPSSLRTTGLYPGIHRVGPESGSAPRALIGILSRTAAGSAYKLWALPVDSISLLHGQVGTWTQRPPPPNTTSHHETFSTTIHALYISTKG